MNEEPKNKVIVKFFQSKFENDILTKYFSLLSTDTFITTSKNYACNQKNEEEHLR